MSEYREKLKSLQLSTGAASSREVSDYRDRKEKLEDAADAVIAERKREQEEVQRIIESNPSWFAHEAGNTPPPADD